MGAKQHTFLKLPLRHLICGALFVASGRVTSAQQAKTPTNGGTVTGHVYFADNNRPARFTTVYLKQVAPPDPQDDFFTVLMDSAVVNMQAKALSGAQRTSDDESDLKSAKAATKGLITSVTDAMISATVKVDGEYIFTGVPPGTYYLHAKAPGYIDTLTEFSSDELVSDDPAIRKRIAVEVPMVTVMGTETARGDLRLERGAVITGSLLYDDGSPASGWTIHAITRQSSAAQASTSVFGIDLAPLEVNQRTDQAITNDTGHFRIAGLPTGNYLLKAQLATAALDRSPFNPIPSSAGSFLSILEGLSGMGSLTLTTYSGNTARLANAEAISIRAGEERNAADIVVSLHTTHSISGVVVSRRDGHFVNDGRIELIAQDDQGKDDPSFKLNASINPDGTFRFDYVPAPGNYTLRCLHAGDTTTTSTMKLLGSLIAERQTNRIYDRVSTTVSVRDEDLTGVRLAVDDATTSPQKTASTH